MSSSINVGSSGHRHDLAKACIVIAGPTLVTLIPMAAAPALPAMAAKFAASFGGNGALFAQLVMTVPAFMLILAAPLAGILSEKLGRRFVLIASLMLFTLAGAAALVTPTAMSLMACRVLLGVAGGGMLTVCLSLAGDFPEGGPRERILGFAVAGASALAALVLVGGGRLVDELGWRAPFAFYLLGIPATIVAWVAVRDETAAEKNERGPAVVTSLRPLWWLYLTAVALTIGMFMPSIQGPFLLVAEGVTSAATQGTVAAACAVVAALSSASFGWLVRFVPPSGIFVLIASCFGFGSLVMALSHGALTIGTGSALMGVAAGLVEATSATVILGRVSEHSRAPAIGLLLSAIFLGQFLNPWVVDPLRQAFGIHGAFIAVGVAFLAMAIVLAIGHLRHSAAAGGARRADA
jgi:MFS family permease